MSQFKKVVNQIFPKRIYMHEKVTLTVWTLEPVSLNLCQPHGLHGQIFLLSCYSLVKFLKALFTSDSFNTSLVSLSAFLV